MVRPGAAVGPLRLDTKSLEIDWKDAFRAWSVLPEILQTAWW